MVNSREAEEKFDEALEACFTAADEVGDTGRPSITGSNLGPMLKDLADWLRGSEAVQILGKGRSGLYSMNNSLAQASAGENWRDFRRILDEQVCPLLGRLAVKLRKANREQSDG